MTKIFITGTGTFGLTRTLDKPIVIDFYGKSMSIELTTLFLYRLESEIDIHLRLLSTDIDYRLTTPGVLHSCEIGAGPVVFFSLLLSMYMLN